MSEGKAINEIFTLIAKLTETVAIQQNKIESLNNRAVDNKDDSPCKLQSKIAAQSKSLKELSATVVTQQEKIKALGVKPISLTNADVLNSINETVTEQFVTKLYKKVNK